MEKVRSRAWVFTQNNPSVSCQEFIDCLGELIYCVIGNEVGESGTPHFQGYVYYHNAKSFATVKKIMPHAHLEVAKGKPEEAAQYCKKDGNFLEKGELPKQGKRSDLDIVMDVVRETNSMREVVNVATSFQSVRMAEVYLKYNEKGRSWKPNVYWFWGSTGSGKTRAAWEMFPDAYDCSVEKWFEGYDGHDTIIVDDFRKDFMKFHRLLKFLDRYQFRMECKGGSRQCLAKNIVITCPYHPEDVYKRKREDIVQLIRRIDEIKMFGNGIRENAPFLSSSSSCSQESTQAEIGCEEIEFQEDGQTH